MNARNKTKEIALWTSGSKYVFLGDILHYNSVNVGVRCDLGTLSGVTVALMMRANTEVDIWEDTLFQLRESNAYNTSNAWGATAQTVGCHENFTVYTWDSTSTDADNGTTVIKPNNIDSGSAGRWVSTTQEYDNLTSIPGLTSSVTNEVLFENIDYTGGPLYLKVTTSGTADSSSKLYVNVNAKK